MSTNGHIPHDLHMHSRASCDSQAAMADMGRSALRRGIREIAFTEHFDCHPDDSCLGFYQPGAYFDQIEDARRLLVPQGLTILAGVEVGEFHRFHARLSPVLDAYPYDVVLGSLHWVGDHSVFDPAFFRAHEPRDAFGAYFAELAQMARGGGFDVLAHPDVIKRTAHRVYGRFEIAEWEDMVRPVWQACIDGGIAVEINTAGLRISVNQVHPAPDALRWYREMGGELITLGSDAHEPGHVGCRLETALEAAHAAGFTRVCHFEKRRVVALVGI